MGNVRTVSKKKAEKSNGRSERYRADDLSRLKEHIEENFGEHRVLF
jgi:hypothetical protein